MLKRKLKKLYFRFGGHLFKTAPLLLSYQLPKTLVIEATNQCMLRCRVCATVNNPIRSKGVMSLELFNQILNQIDWSIKRINFSYAGEPLINKDIFKMVKLAGKKGIPSIIETNGMLLERCVDELLVSGLSKLNIALDGVSQESISKYREGINFTTVMLGIKDIVNKRDRLGLKKPEIHLQFIVMKHNEGEMKMAMEIAKEIGVDFIDLKSMILSGGIWLSESERNRFASEFLPENEEFKRYQLINGSWVLKNQLAGFCPYVIPGMVVIMWNGDVTICTMDVNGQFVIGNIREKSLRLIWRDNKYTELRKKILKRELKECRECAYLVDHYASIKIKEGFAH